MKFTADEAFEASKAGEPIIISIETAARYLRQHGLTEPSDVRDMLFQCELPHTTQEIDAATVLGWLGY